MADKEDEKTSRSVADSLEKPSVEESCTTDNAKIAFFQFCLGRYKAAKSDLVNNILPFAQDVLFEKVKLGSNMDLIRYYKEGCSKPHEFLSHLSSLHIAAINEDLIQSTQTWGVLKGVAALKAWPIPNYNRALLLFQLRQYQQAADILQHMFDLLIHIIDDFLAIKVCLLLIELKLLTREPEQAEAVIVHLENSCSFPTLERVQASAFSSGVDASSEDGPTEDRSNHCDTGFPSLAVGTFLAGMGTRPNRIVADEYKFLVLLYRARIEIAKNNHKTARKIVKLANDVLNNLKGSRIFAEHFWSLKRLKPKISSFAGDETWGQDALAVHWAITNQHAGMTHAAKAYLEFLKQNLPKSLRLLTYCQINFSGLRLDELPPGGTLNSMSLTSPPEAVHPSLDPLSAVSFFNNVACVHMVMNKPTLAAFYLSKAMQMSEHIRTNPEQYFSIRNPTSGISPMCWMASKSHLNRQAEIAYNTGLILLFKGNYADAFICIRDAALQFPNNTRAWLRLAEACIGLYRDWNAASNSSLITPSCNNFNTPFASEEIEGDKKQKNVQPKDTVSMEELILLSQSGGAQAVMNSCLAEMYEGQPNLISCIKDHKAGRTFVINVKRPILAGLMCESISSEEKSTRFVDIVKAVSKAQKMPATRESLAEASNEYINIPPLLMNESLGVTKADRLAHQSLTFAISCLRNALQLVSTLKCRKQSKGRDNNVITVSECRECEASCVEDAALLKLAYCCLCKNDCGGALLAVSDLFRKNNMDPSTCQTVVSDTVIEWPSSMERCAYIHTHTIE
eukprot:GHVL01027765.1.p1 GENE.GHVL01027765.1~~GHVL01027765.1.p1  ORF type:complete len:793 (+),score=91.96 GHVL01027765.1:170-2548(+)